MAASLGLFAGSPAAIFSEDTCDLLRLPAPRGHSRAAARPAAGPDGALTLLAGWIDNGPQLRALLDLPRSSTDEVVYAHALARWGADADRRVFGHYAAITIRADRSLRLSRSPWGGPSLFFARQQGQTFVCSIPRPIFAAGFPKRLIAGQLTDLALRVEDVGDEDHWYEGLRRVPHGSIVMLDKDGEARRQWYDPHAVAPVRLADDEAYEAAARDLLTQSVARALATTKRPAMLLSGGLDSALAASEVLAQLPDGRRLPGFTVVPVPAWDGWCLRGWYGDEEARVRAFAARHPALDAHFVQPPADGFTHALDRMMLATDTARAAHAPSTLFHGAYAAAAAAGCDTVFNAVSGNETFSNEGRWAYAEYARRLRWRELAALLANQPGDTRPMWRRMLAHSVLPHLPVGAQNLVRNLIHHGAPLKPMETTLWHPGSDRAARDRRLGQAGLADRNARPASRRTWVARLWHSLDIGGEVPYGFEQVYGMRQRDLMHSREIIEFCIGLPTDQFVRGGVRRYLARRLARGRMPIEQVNDPRMGLHNPDWHARMTATLPNVRADVVAARMDDELAQIFDLDGAERLLDHWPETTPDGPGEFEAHYHGLTTIAIAGRFARFAKGSNR